MVLVLVAGAVAAAAGVAVVVVVGAVVAVFDFWSRFDRALELLDPMEEEFKNQVSFK